MLIIPPPSRPEERVRPAWIGQQNSTRTPVCPSCTTFRSEATSTSETMSHPAAVSLTFTSASSSHRQSAPARGVRPSVCASVLLSLEPSDCLPAWLWDASHCVWWSTRVCSCERHAHPEPQHTHSHTCTRRQLQYEDGTLPAGAWTGWGEQHWGTNKSSQASASVRTTQASDCWTR